jgi:hypothetical protein
MQDPYEKYYAEKDCAEVSDCCMIFHTNTPSHDRWKNFVEQVGSGLTDIIQLLHDRYQAQFKIGQACWWIEFPDWETRCAFEITWMNNYHANPDQFA